MQAAIRKGVFLMSSVPSFVARPHFGRIRQELIPEQFVPSLLNPGRRTVLKALGALAVLAEEGCRTLVQPSSEVTLVLMDQAWLNKAFQAGRQQELGCIHI